MVKDKREIIAYCPFCKTTTQQEVEYNDKGEKRIMCSRCKKTLFRGSNTGLTEWIKKYYKE